MIEQEMHFYAPKNLVPFFKKLTSASRGMMIYPPYSVYGTDNWKFGVAFDGLGDPRCFNVRHAISDQSFFSGVKHEA